MVNGVLEVLYEIATVKQVLASPDFGIDPKVVATVTGQTTWNQIQLILGSDSARFMEFLTEVESRLHTIIPEDVIAMNRAIAELHPVAA